MGPATGNMLRRLFWSFLALLASLLQAHSLGTPDLSVQVGYWTFNVYTITFFVNDPTDFPTPAEWEWLMTFEAYSLTATQTAENSGTSFTCLYQCDTYSAIVYQRIVVKESEAAIAEEEACAEGSYDRTPMCFPNDVSGATGFERLVVGDWFWPGYYSTTHISWIQPERHLPEGYSYNVGGTFDVPLPMVPADATEEDLTDVNFWTVTFNVWARLNATVFDTVCIAGYGFSELTGTCDQCPLSSYRPVTQRTEPDCWLCPQNSTGTDVGDAQNWRCICDAGFAAQWTPDGISEAAQEGRTEKYCLACSAGSYGSAGSEECTMCTSGFYSPAPAQAQCTAAPAGSYQPAWNATRSLLCEAGTYTSWSGATECDACPAGYYGETTGMTACWAAPAGHYTNGTGATEYLACSPGTYQATAGGAQCSDCEPGSFNNGSAATSCELTTPGHYQNASGQIGELPCPVGQYNADEGAASCQACSPGSYSPTTAASSCIAALPGYYQSLAGQTDSSPCEPGTYSSSTGASVCEACEAGSFSNSSASSGCNSCSRGHFQHLEGQTFELPCPAGSYNPSTGMSACFACDPGQYAGEDGQVRCDICPRGTYGDVSDFNDEYSFETSTVNCSSCPSTSTTAEVGSESMEDCLCPEGSWGDPSACTPCVDGMLCNEQGLLLPQQEEGYLVVASTSRRLQRRTAASGSNISGGDFQIWKCPTTDACPAGPLGTCAGNRDASSVACGRCLEDYHFDRDGSCTPCSTGEAALANILCFVLGIVCLVALAFQSNRELGTQPKAVGKLIATVGMAVAAFQIMSMFVSLAVTWKNPLKFCLELVTLLSINLTNLNTECLLGSDASALYGLRQAVPLVAAVLLLGVFFCKRRWYNPELHLGEEYVNTVGATMQLLFIAVLISITIPFICYDHPNGKSSLVSNPDILCFEESSHVTMVATSILALCFVVLPFVVLVLYGVLRLPAAKRSPTSMTVHLRTFKFLFQQYEPHAYYFGLVALARALLVCLVPIVIRDKGSAQVLAIATVLLIFQICVRCVQPWSGSFSNGFDGALTAILILLLLSAKLTGDLQQSDELINAVGFTCFIACLVAVIAGIAVNAHWYLRPHPFWTYFICHHKGHAGTQARYLQLTFIQMTGRSCFIDSDHLVNLDGLFDIVRSKIRHLVVHLTSDTLKRPWCAGEITVAYLTHKRAIPIYTPSFEKPPDSYFAAPNILEYIAKSDFFLSDYGLGEEALSQAFHWILHDPSLQTVTARMNAASRLTLVGIVEDCTGITSKEGNPLSQVSIRRTGSASASLEERASRRVVVAADPDDEEACAGAGILMLKIVQKVVEAGIEGVCLLHELPDLDTSELEKVALRAHSLIVVLSEGSLNLDLQIRLVHEATQAAESGLAVVPLTLPGFRFPSQAYFAEHLPSRYEEEGYAFAQSMKAFFKRIAVHFATHSSDQVLEAQTSTIFDRIDKAHVVGKQSRSIRGMGTKSDRTLSVVSRGLSATPAEPPSGEHDDDDLEFDDLWTM